MGWVCSPVERGGSEIRGCVGLVEYAGIPVASVPSVTKSLGKPRPRGRRAAFLALLWVVPLSYLYGQAGGPAADPPPEAAMATAAAAAPAAEATLIYAPLTQRERLHTYLKRLVSAEAMVRSAVGASIGQLRDVPPEWREGTLGFGRRFGSSYAEYTVRETLMFGSSSALHEDNRYFRCGETGFGKRLKYALESSFLARHDDGTRHFSFSKIGSFMGASLISRIWQPPSSSGLVHAGSGFGISMGVSAGFDVAREFVPDLFHRMHGSRPF